MKFIKQNPGLLRSARSWGALGLLLALVVTFGSWQATSIPSTFIVEGTVTYSAQPQPPTPCATPPSGMVAWYTLDEQSGAGVVYDVADWDDNGNTLDANGSTTTISATAGPPPAGPVPVTSLPLSLPSGKVGSALYFYGPYVQVPLPAADLNFAKGDLSIDAWVWPVQVGPGRIQPIVDRLDLSQNKGYAFYVEDGLLRFRMGDGTFAGSASTGSVTYGTWNHVAVTVNRSDPLSGVKFYINGALVGFGPTVTGIIDNAQAVWIGKSRLSPPAGFGEIAIDELEVFNRVLTPTEINDIFQADKAGKCKSDLGDAPDSTNHAAAQMATGYGPTANFPTVYDPGAPHGPIHLNATGDAWLGKAVTLEGEADQGWDQDPTNNILPGPNIANKDGADDGVSPLPILPFYCSTQTLTYSVTVIGPTKPRYVNVWFDFKQDGDWDDVIQCPGTPLSAREWAVQNHLINLGPGFHPGLVTPSFVAFLDPNKSISTWMRVTLTDVPVAPAQADGSGPPGGYPFGETEDYFLGKDPSGSAEICVFKFEDKNGNGMWDINFSNPNDPNNEPLLSGWTFNVNPGPPNQVTTDPTGNICFSVPAPGTYTITEVPLPGWVPTSLNPQTQTVFSTTRMHFYFGNRRREEVKCDPAIKKTVNPNPVQTGGTVTVTLALTVPAGQICEATTVVVQDQLPPTMVYQNLSMTPSPLSDWSCVTTIPSCYNVIPLIGPYTAMFSFMANVNAPPGTSITNCATATVSGQLISKSCVPISVLPKAACDLAIKKSVTPNPVQSGQQVTFTLTVQNVGTGPCQGITTVTDGPLPWLQVTSVAQGGSQWNCSVAPPNPGATIKCTWDASIQPVPPGPLPAITITGTVIASATGQLPNCAAVSNPNDTNTANNQSCVIVQVTGGKCDLAISKEVKPNPLISGQPATYFITVFNKGDGTCNPTITVTDTLASGLSFISAGGPGVVCVPFGQTVTCTSNNPLGPGQSLQIQINVTVKIEPGKEARNCATVKNPNDVNLTNNEACITTVVGKK